MAEVAATETEDWVAFPLRLPASVAERARRAVYETKRIRSRNALYVRAITVYLDALDRQTADQNGS